MYPQRSCWDSGWRIEVSGRYFSSLPGADAGVLRRHPTSSRRGTYRYPVQQGLLYLVFVECQHPIVRSVVRPGVLAFELRRALVFIRFSAGTLGPVAFNMGLRDTCLTILFFNLLCCAAPAYLCVYVLYLFVSFWSSNRLFPCVLLYATARHGVQD